MQESSKPFIKELIPSSQTVQSPSATASPGLFHFIVSDMKASRSSLGAVKATVSGQFKNQLTSLMTLIGSTSCHFIRCVSPNNQK